jgi:hypothetical protein
MIEISMSALTTHEQIKDRAYALWEADGRPEGRDKHYWESAERQLSEELGLDLSAEQTEVEQPPLVAGFPSH